MDLRRPLIAAAVLIVATISTYASSAEPEADRVTAPKRPSSWHGQ